MLAAGVGVADLVHRCPGDVANPLASLQQDGLQEGGRTSQHVHADHALLDIAQGGDLRAGRFQLLFCGIHAPGEQDRSIPVEHAQPVESLSYVEAYPVAHHPAPLVVASCASGFLGRLAASDALEPAEPYVAMGFADPDRRSSRTSSGGPGGLYSGGHRNGVQSEAIPAPPRR